MKYEVRSLAKTSMILNSMVLLLCWVKKVNKGQQDTLVHTVLLSKLLRLFVRDVPLRLQVCFVAYEDDHLQGETESSATSQSTGENKYPQAHCKQPRRFGEEHFKELKKPDAQRLNSNHI